MPSATPPSSILLPRLSPLIYDPGAFEIVREPIKVKNKKWKPRGPFRFLDLPSELRNRIYEHAIFVPEDASRDGTVDLNPVMSRMIAPRLRLLQTCKRVYEEAYPIFYGRQAIRIFPTHPAYMNSKKPVLMQLPRRYRQAIQTLELRLGPGWGKPPKCQTLSPRLGLKDCTSVRTLKVFVEIDPSSAIFQGFRISDGFYTAFASGMLEGVLQQCTSVDTIEFDAYPSVKKRDPLMTALLRQANLAGKRIAWGPERGWQWDKELDPCALQVLGEALSVVTLQEQVVA